MTYIHTGTKPVTLKNDPIDPDATDWVFFVYDTWLREGETIVSHEALVEGGVLATDSTYLGAMTDSDGVDYTDVYGVQISVEEGASEVRVTHRVSTTTAGAVPLSRLDIDHTASISVKTL